MSNTSLVSTKVRYINSEWKGRDEAPRIGSKESRRENTAYQDIKVHDARPRISKDEIGLEKTGFTEISAFGDYKMNPYHSNSNRLILCAKKR